MDEKFCGERKQRNVTVDYIRGISIIIVVIGHAIQVNLATGETCFIWSKLILSFQMPLLFYISGYTTGFSFPYVDTKKFIKNKVCRILLPYLCWENIHYIIICSLTVNYRKFSVRGLCTEIFISDFWFLRELFIFLL